MLERTIFLATILIVLGLIDYTVTRILIQGSIFETFRKMLKTKSAHSAFWRHVNELFSCHLCLGAEVSLWVLSLPLHLFIGSPFLFFLKPGIPGALLPLFWFGSWFGIAMAITGIHYLLWDMTIDKSTAKKESLSPEMVELLTHLASHTRNKKSEHVATEVGINFSDLEIQAEFNTKQISLGEFTLLFYFCQYSCASYDCSINRPKCIQDMVKRFAEGKLMRVLGLIGTGKIPEDTLERLQETLFECIDYAIRDLREDDSIKLGSHGWYEAVKKVYLEKHIESISF